MTGKSNNIHEKKLAKCKSAQNDTPPVDIFESMSDALVYLDKDWRITYMNSHASQLFGKKPKEMTGKHFWTEFPEGFGRSIRENYEKVMAEQKAISVEEYAPAYDKWFESRLFLAETGISIFFQDISIRKKAEISLRESEERFRILVEQAVDGIFLGDPQGNFIGVNSKGCEMSGYSLSELLKMNMQDLFSPEEREKTPLRYDFLKNGDIVFNERMLRRKDGTEIPIEMHTKMMPDTTYQSFFRDFTNKKKAEAKIRESEAIYRTIFENTGTATIIIEEDTTISITNAKFAELAGLPKEEIESKRSWTEFVVEKDLDEMQKSHHMRRTDPGKALRSYEFGFKDIRGNIKDILLYIDLIPGTTKSIASLLDITDRKKSERELQYSKMLLRSMIDSLPVWITAADLEGNYFIANQYYAKTFGIPLDKIEGHNFKEFFPNDLYTKQRVLIDQSISSGETVEFTEEVEFVKGQPTAVIGNYTPLYDTEGTLFGVSGVAIDISKQKKAEEEIRQLNLNLHTIVKERTLELEQANSALKAENDERAKAEEYIRKQLKEREILLKEVHHRVKNNMQVISSILDLQASTISDKKAISVLRDCQTRVQTMALVHEKLYQTRDFSNINFTEYLDNLFQFLFKSYKSADQDLTYMLEAESFPLSIDTMIVMGLITNELVSNSLKYAFTEKKEGGIEFTLDRKDEHDLIMTISDNGKGLPEGFDYKNAESLGLQLVSLLTEQIQGKLDIQSSAKGTKFIITFPLIASN